MPLWVSLSIGNEASRARPRAAQVVAVLAQAATHGLRTRDYDLDWLQAQLPLTLERGAAARFDVRLTRAFVRYLMDLNLGRVDPASLGLHLRVRDDRAALGNEIDAILANEAPAIAAAALAPDLSLYRDLLPLLAQWRVRAEGTPPPALPAYAGVLKPGDALDEPTALMERLRWLGDLGERPGQGDRPERARPPQRVEPPERVDPPERGALADEREAGGYAAAAHRLRYDGELVAAVKRFQQRHGLEPDGVLGAQTRAALDVAPAQRVQQIELSLERMRWLGRRPAGRFIAINIPEYRLWAVPAMSRGDAAATNVLEMRVIVGATVTATPVFHDAIESIEFNPFWNVPPSIASKELYPKLARDPGYLARQEMQWLGDAGDNAQAALASGRARIRQKPGALNALGTIKFVMPNAFNVYLHDTPSRTLFSRSRRDFSHGCIRLERPRDLAQWILADQPRWDALAIDQAISDGRNRTVALASSVPVLILYSTVNVDVDGRIRFLPDLYGLDAKLARALAE